MKRYLIYICLLVSAAAAAQDVPRVEASLDADSVMIGDQFTLDVRVEKDLMQVVDFPALAGIGSGGAASDGDVSGGNVSGGDVSGGNVSDGALGENIEVLSENPVDTLAADGRRQTLRKRYLLTVWREGNYNLGRFPALYVDKNRVDTLLSADSLRIVVSTFDIDLETDKPLSIKKIRLMFGEWSGWLLLGLAGLAVVAAAVWFVVKFRRKIPFLAPREILPPHVEAIRKLEALKHQKLPQNGRLKQYYSGVTDILREYISARFDIGAMEMTSAEIVDVLKPAHAEKTIDDKRWSDLKALLATADMVKFARAEPDLPACEADWLRAYYFVEETKLVIDD